MPLQVAPKNLSHPANSSADGERPQQNSTAAAAVASSNSSEAGAASATAVIAAPTQPGEGGRKEGSHYLQLLMSRDQTEINYFQPHFAISLVLIY